MSGKYSNIKVVSFDMDGTILNTEADLEAAARRALKLGRTAAYAASSVC